MKKNSFAVLLLFSFILAFSGCSHSQNASIETSNLSSSTASSTSFNAKLSVSYSSLNVISGQNASISIKTSPGSIGKMEVLYRFGRSKAAPQKADRSGNITWNWKVGTRVVPGTYPVIITVDDASITKILKVY